MIKSFKCKEAEKIFNREFSKKLPNDIQRVAARRLMVLDFAQVITDLKSPPANHLEALKNNRQGQHSIRINDQWRVCFTWFENAAYDVEIVDYH